MAVLSDLALAGVICSLVYYVVGAAVAMRFARTLASSALPIPNRTPQVALLKPLHGASKNLARNLHSLFTLDYRAKKLIFGLATENDPAADIIATLKAQARQIPVEVSVGETPGAANRKVAKLMRMVKLAPEAEVFVLSDADVSVERDHLRRVVAELMASEKTGVVTCLYRAVAEPTLAARLDALFVNTDFVPMALLSNAFEKMRHAFGATIAIKRAVLDALDDFRVLKDLLADDFFVGKIAADKGYEVKLSSSLVTIWSEERTLGDFWQHQLRWARTYRTVRPLSLASIIIHGPLWALVLLASTGAAGASLILVPLLVAIRLVFAALMLEKVVRVPWSFADPCLVIVKDLLMSAIWLASLLGNQVTWGGRRFRLAARGTMVEIESPSSPAA
jgi:ceramide glucosyltransferase